jgi:pimeloyl-ACP methyl ester carboxylesterase
MLLRVSICFLLFSFSLNAQNIKRKGSLGVGLYNTIPDSVLKRIKFKSDKGSLVQFVVPNTTADFLGVKPFDFIITCNKLSIQSTPSLIQLAKQFKDGDSISLTLIRSNKQVTISGLVKGKPYETSDKINITYGDFRYEDSYIRTILKKPLSKKSLGTVYFVHGIPCYSLDNMQSNDPTKLAIDAMVERGYNVYYIEKKGMGDSYSSIPCEAIGFDKELDVFKEGYKNLLSLKDIDTSRIFIFGHSLGGVTAPLLAEQFHPKGVVVYGTVFKPWGEYLKDALVYQAALYGENLDSLKQMVAQMEPTFNELFVNRKTARELSKDTNHLKVLQQALDYNVITNLGLSGRTIEFHEEINSHNVAEAWKNSNTDVFAIYGESDIAANNSLDHEALIKHVNKYHPGKGKFLLMPKTNHMFQEIGTMDDYIKMQADPNKYQVFASQHFNAKLFDIVCEWMTDKLTK